MKRMSSQSVLTSKKPKTSWFRKRGNQAQSSSTLGNYEAYASSSAPSSAPSSSSAWTEYESYAASTHGSRFGFPRRSGSLRHHPHSSSSSWSWSSLSFSRERDAAQIQYDANNASFEYPFSSSAYLQAQELLQQQQQQQQQQQPEHSQRYYLAGGGNPYGPQNAGGFGLSSAPWIIALSQSFQNRSGVASVHSGPTVYSVIFYILGIFFLLGFTGFLAEQSGSNLPIVVLAMYGLFSVISSIRRTVASREAIVDIWQQLVKVITLIFTIPQAFFVSLLNSREGNRRAVREADEMNINTARRNSGNYILNEELVRLLASNRDFQPEDYELLLQLDEQSSRLQGGAASHATPTTSPTPDLPSYEYHRTSEETIACPICLETIDEGRIMKICPCAHQFCGSCIDRWFQDDNHRSCPVCKMDLSLPG
eukprot:CAMPEP_0184697420 /NCGR_PEP_ID=MMETSP0313-20130426/4388_1 /TAXON_ID=2792 /ORGANISM="Porphyridium aerugineum, Strain SAG 1380-2" /LENGTH=422 /DNA_ID=CAMNT_0027156213 /DNA_START=187 /DNA_END=1455 /DNA_ORIENTATION=-